MTTTDHSYPYYKYINSPAAMGMSDAGTINNLTKNIDGLMEYVKLLTEGTGKASATGKPLGNKYFIDTQTKCTVAGLDGNVDATAKEDDRFIYINNVPTGNFGLATLPGSRGLIPGVIGGLASLNPMGMMDAVTSGTKPPCAQVTLQTIDEQNNMSAESHYVALTDIKKIDPCSFWDKANNRSLGQNPMTKDRCTERFQSSIGETETETEEGEPRLPDDMVTQVYFASLAGLGLYIIFRLSRGT